jgi:hypothetical protein
VVAKIVPIGGILAGNPGRMEIDPVQVIPKFSVVYRILGFDRCGGPLTPTMQGVFENMDFVPLAALKKGVEGVESSFHQDRM